MNWAFLVFAGGITVALAALAAWLVVTDDA